MKSGSLLMLLALGVLCVTPCETRPHAKDRGQGPERKALLLACFVTQNYALDTEPCNDEKCPDYNATALALTYEAENPTVSYYKGHYRPKRENVCKVTDVDGNEKDESCRELETCQGSRCILLRFKMENRGNNVTRLYQWGISPDEKPEINYEDMLRKKACASNGDCEDGWSCDLVICQKEQVADKDDDGEYEEANEDSDGDYIPLNLLNHHGKENLRDIDDHERDDAEEDDNEEYIELFNERYGYKCQSGKRISKGHRGSGGREDHGGHPGGQVHGRSRQIHGGVFGR